MRFPNSKFPNWVIVSDELEIIIHLIKGLSLLTRSLVIYYYRCDMDHWHSVQCIFIYLTFISLDKANHP